MAEPTVTFFADDDEGGVSVPVTALPGWHEHPECVEVSGKPLRHLHGMSAQSPHTHEPKQSWGPPVDSDPSQPECCDPLGIECVCPATNAPTPASHNVFDCNHGCSRHGGRSNPAIWDGLRSVRGCTAPARKFGGGHKLWPCG